MKKLISAQLNNLRGRGNRGRGMRGMRIGIRKKRLEFICKYSKICLTPDKIKKKQCTKEYTKTCQFFKAYETYGEGYNHLGV